MVEEQQPRSRRGSRPWPPSCRVFERADFQLGTWAGGENVDGVIQMPYYSLGPEAERFISMAYEFGWVTPFDWGTWAQTPEGQRLSAGGDAVAAATPDDLARLLTTLIRSERSVTVSSREPTSRGS